MNMLKVVSPVLKIAFERVGKPEIINLPDILRLGGTGAIVTCNHIGWADSLWLSYAVHPRQLRHMSKQELFNQPMTKWVMGHVTGELDTYTERDAKETKRALTKARQAILGN